MKKVVTLLLIALGTTYGTVSAQKHVVVLNDKTGWHKIGKTTINFLTDRDVIKYYGADKFAAIQFKVIGSPIYLSDLEVYYDSGDRQNIKADISLAAGTESKHFDLNGGERNLKKIIFIYKTLSNRKDKKAHVQIWGLKTNADKK